MSEKESNDSENANVSDTEDEITKSEERPEGDSEPLQGAIEKLSEHKPEVASEFMAMMGAGPMTNPLHRKMEGSHITQLLELAADHDEREFELQKQAQ